MTIEDAEQKLLERFDAVARVLTEFIADEMQDMDREHLLRFNDEVSRATKELALQIQEQNTRLCFWLHRIIAAKESTRRS